MATLTSGEPARTSLVAAMPSRSGMRTSMRTTSGLSAWAWWIAARPSPASPTTSIALSVESTAFRPARMRSSSSTRSTRPAARSCSVAVGQVSTNPEGAVARSRLQAPSEQSRPLAHPDEAVAGSAGSQRRPGRVAHADLERARPEADLDVGASLAVPGGVGERLLEDPVRRLVERGRAAAVVRARGR